MSPTAEPIIRTEGLTKRYGDLTAVDHLDLAVYPGEVFGLLGPNGAGKTTTILMLLGLTEASEGRAEVMGFDPARHPLEVKRRVGYMPDNVGFYGTMTGRENLRYTATLNGLDREDAESRIDELLVQVGLSDAGDHRVDTYSRGMRQRLGVADALVKEPSVLILDEPTVAIDPEGVAEMLALIRSLSRERGVALLLSSHLLHQVQSVCDRVGIFARGRMVAQGPPADLAARLGSEAVALEVGTADDPGVEGTLRSAEGVTGVDRDDRDHRVWRVTGAGDIGESVAVALVGAGYPVWHLRRVSDELDEVYRRYFHEAEADRTGGDGTQPDGRDDGRGS